VRNNKHYRSLRVQLTFLRGPLHLKAFQQDHSTGNDLDLQLPVIPSPENHSPVVAPG